MKNIFCVFLIILAIIVVSGCQQKQVNNNTERVKPVSLGDQTHKSPKNPIDEELIDWKPYNGEAKVNYKKYSEYFSKFGEDKLKNRIMVVSLDEKLKKAEEELKLALFCSGKFVIMERDLEKYGNVIKNIKNKSGKELQEASKKLYSQYLAILENDKVNIFDLAKGRFVTEDTIKEENVINVASAIVEKANVRNWEAVVSTVNKPEEKKEEVVVVNVGKLDGVKKGDSFKLESEDLDDIGELLIDDVNDKFATGRVVGDKRASKGMRIKVAG